MDFEIIDIKAKDLNEKLKDFNWNTLDVRDQKERSAGSIEGLHIPLDDLEKNIDLIQNEKNLVVYCRCGNRSITAIEKLVELGFKGDLLNLEGGMMSVIRERAKQ